MAENTKIEALADAILRAAGSSLHHYARTSGRRAILDATKEAFDAGREAGWEPIDKAPYGARVEVRAGSMIFLAELHPGVSEDEDGNACDQWAAALDGEHPPCWTDGACWASNADEMTSLQPTAWRYPAPEPQS